MHKDICAFRFGFRVLPIFLGGALLIASSAVQAVAQGASGEGRGLAKAQELDENPLAEIGSATAGAAVGGLVVRTPPNSPALEIERITSGSELSEAEMAAGSRFGMLSRAGAFLGAAAIGAAVGYDLKVESAIPCVLAGDLFITANAEDCSAVSGRPVAAGASGFMRN